MLKIRFFEFADSVFKRFRVVVEVIKLVSKPHKPPVVLAEALFGVFEDNPVPRVVIHYAGLVVTENAFLEVVGNFIFIPSTEVNICFVDWIIAPAAVWHSNNTYLVYSTNTLFMENLTNLFFVNTPLGKNARNN